MKRRLAFLRVFLRDPGGDFNEYMLLLVPAITITAVVIRAYRDEIRAALAEAIQAISGLLGVWR